MREISVQHHVTSASDINALYPGHDLSPWEVLSLAAFIDANHERPLMGLDRELFDVLLERAERTQARRPS